MWLEILFFKPKYSKKFVGWHEDKTYWKLKNNKVLTFSIAITESLPENGCLKILHERRKVEYKINDTRNNMLARFICWLVGHKRFYKEIVGIRATDNMLRFIEDVKFHELPICPRCGAKLIN